MAWRPSPLDESAFQGKPGKLGYELRLIVQPGFFHKAKNYLSQLLSLAIFFGGGLAFSLYYLVNQRILRRKVDHLAIRNRFGCLFRWYIHHLNHYRNFQIEMDPKIAQLGTSGPLILAANHPSILDAILIVAKLPEVACIMRGSLLHNPCMGGGALMAQYVTNDSGVELIRQGQEKLRNGEKLLIFPEGTRTRFPEAVNPFKKGFALLAASTGTPVQTILIEHEGHYLGKTVSLFHRAQTLIKFRLHLGASFQVEPGETARAFSDRLEAYFSRQLQHTKTGIYLAPPNQAVQTFPISHASRESDSRHPSPQL